MLCYICSVNQPQGVHVMLCYVMLGYFMVCYVTLCYVTLRYVKLHYVTINSEYKYPSITSTI